ncbi:hypothetical protein GCM10009836_44290 [Pseudonocardia ailaonensis]|uniref:Uncharacterized protein n=1 Tax=Pseudonocardia ailaonensis TaxID=367279 RepID=A0ABN2NAX0_9PSEU
MELKIGQRLRSQVCDTEVIVVRSGSVELTCGGAPVILHGQDPEAGLALVPGLDGGTQIGKRYTDERGVLEILVTKPGKGTLADGQNPLPLRESRELPASD